MVRLLLQKKIQLNISHIDHGDIKMSALSCWEDLFIIDLLHVTKRMTKDKNLPFFVSLITVIPFLIKIVRLLLVIYYKASLNLGMGSQSTHVCQCAKIVDFY